MECIVPLTLNMSQRIFTVKKDGEATQLSESSNWQIVRFVSCHITPVQSLKPHTESYGEYKWNQ